ncbi:hypothetical protein [Mycoplana dimorpha]|uniref:hypothetical protein n=1 Tax=Mycoplana dimorpha TaxID=28320 RepID=UPI0011B289EA|nr:hypothetical protein [Mycoplana dimorpha]
MNPADSIDRQDRKRHVPAIDELRARLNWTTGFPGIRLQKPPDLISFPMLGSGTGLEGSVGICRSGVEGERAAIEAEVLEAEARINVLREDMVALDRVI